MQERLERLTVYLEKTLCEQVFAEANQLDRPISWVVRRILETHYAKAHIEQDEA